MKIHNIWNVWILFTKRIQHGYEIVYEKGVSPVFMQ